MMTIVFITDQIYLHGGAERVLSNKVNYLSQLNNTKVHILTTEQKGKKPCYPINKNVIINDLKINYNRKKSYFTLLNIIKIIPHFIKLKSFFLKTNPDVIITLSSQFDYYFLPFINKKTPIIREFHSSRHFYFENRQERTSYLKNIIYRLNDFIEKKYTYNAILTNDEKKYFYSNNTVVIPNALTRFPEKASSLENKKLISAGRVAPVKGFENLINAWELVSKKNKEWVLEIYGNGEESYINELRALIKLKKLEKSLKIKSAISNIEDKMIESSGFIMTSLTECFPMVLLEAMSVGLPIISFDCPNGPKNIITHNIDGLLVPYGNILLLSKEIDCLINNISMRKQFGVNAKINVKKYNKNDIMKRWFSLFNKAVKEKHSKNISKAINN